MKEVKFSKKVIEFAEKKAHDMGTLHNSITRGEGSVAGFIGEFAALKVYGGKIDNDFDHDLVLPDGRTADVKTKRTTVPPKEHYECSVAAFNTKQKCDVYLFVRVDMERQVAYVLGHYDKTKYFEDARFLKKGMIDGDNNFKVKSDCYNMEINRLEETS